MKKYVKMQLNNEPYNSIKSGEKTVELRLFDEKRRTLSTGDIIIFSNRTDETQTLSAEIIALYRAESFLSLLTPEILSKSGFSDYSASEAAECMRKYYTAEDERSFGVLGIELKLAIDIHSEGEYPANLLSNFYPHSFIIDGVECHSMEGFLQSMKYCTSKSQKRVALLCGKKAKSAGAKKRLWRCFGIVFWQGRIYKRGGSAFWELLRRAYGELYSQNTAFREALNSTRGRTIVHSIGLQDKRKTILTECEFISLLNELRG